MEDFEVHPRGTSEEIKASRALAKTLEQLTEQYGENILASDVRNAYNKLRKVYAKQIEMEKD